MTTCAECLGSISTMRLADLRPGSAIAEHCSSCADCSSIAQDIAFAERRLAEALAETRSVLAPDDLSNRALEESERMRRKEMARWARGFLMAAGCVTFWFFMQDLFVPWADGTKRTAAETFTTHCLFTDQASSIATPYLRDGGSAIYTASDLHTITIRGRADEVARAKMEVLGVDARQTCDLPVSDAESQRAKFEADRKAAGDADAAATLSQLKAESQRAKFEADRKAAAGARAATSGDIPKKD